MRKKKDDFFFFSNIILLLAVKEGKLRFKSILSWTMLIWGEIFRPERPTVMLHMVFKIYDEKLAVSYSINPWFLIGKL
jgi:hypothetical protein